MESFNEETGIDSKVVKLWREINLELEASKENPPSEIYCPWEQHYLPTRHPFVGSFVDHEDVGADLRSVVVRNYYCSLCDESHLDGRSGYFSEEERSNTYKKLIKK